MRTFVQLSVDGKRVHWKFQREQIPVFESSIVILDVTDLIPQPEEGWHYDGQNFSPPPLPTAQELAQIALLGLKPKLLLAIAKRAAGEITQVQFQAFWDQVKAKLIEAGEET